MNNHQYNPQDIEKKIAQFWKKNNFFKTKINTNINQENFCIMLPPPNVTGNLHIGHAFQQTLMDILIRYQKMQGKNTLLQTGIDHAGIAMQIMVEKYLTAQYNFNPSTLKKEKLINIANILSKQNKNTIIKQMQRLGISADWKNTRFTLDSKFSNSVKEVFIQLYKEKLIYRGKRIVHWDPILCTAVSDLEIKNREVTDYIWYIKYPLTINNKNSHVKSIIIATTRPETILADTAIAVNPSDTRYQHLVGQSVVIPLIGRQIPIISDNHANINKETGCVKITPAHDFYDYEVGKRHNLPIINIFTKNACILKKPEIFNINNNTQYPNKYYNTLLNYTIPEYLQGLNRFTARKKIIQILKTQGFIVNQKIHNYTLPYNDRSNVITEPMLTDQWYLHIKPLAEIALQMVKEKKINLIPQKYTAVFYNWMYNVQDWCISRQLWWGHKIPAWFNLNDKNQIYVGNNEKEIRNNYNINNNIILKQDEDVLDTWFSSGLWTFATLGWPQNTKKLKIFHPTNVLITGYDIIFFWVARMIMLTSHFIKDKNGRHQIPFSTVYITGLIRDKKGQKMSKSLNNIIDPISIIDGATSQQNQTPNNHINSILKISENKNKKKNNITSSLLSSQNNIKKYSADSLRFTFAALSSNGYNIKWCFQRLEGYYNFCNKLWNASRFVILNTNTNNKNIYNDNNNLQTNTSHYSLINSWIYDELNQTIKIIRNALDTYRFDLVANILYEFIWNQFCNWYIEFSKVVLHVGMIHEINETKTTLIIILKKILKLSHPVIPFITDAIWIHINQYFNNKTFNSLILEKFPTYNQNLENKECYPYIKLIKNIISAIRNIRVEYTIPFSNKINIFLILKNDDFIKLQKINECLKYISILSNSQNIYIYSKCNITTQLSELQYIKKILDDETELFIPIVDIIDKNTTSQKLSIQLNKLNIQITELMNKLNCSEFINKAPQIIINKILNKLKILKENKEKLLEKYKKIIIS